MKMLLIEDSLSLRRNVGRALRKSGYVVDATGDGKEGLWFAESNRYDVIILDLMLPGLDGLSLLRALRAKDNDTHVLILTAKDTVEDRVLGLNLGADDYLIKPFALAELLARVQTLCRRVYGKKATCLFVDGLKIDTVARSVTVEGKPIVLTPREYKLLEYLAMRRGELVTRTEIEAHIYDSDVEPMSNVVDSAMSTLRKKITLPGTLPLIRTRRGMGYMFGAKTT